MDSENLLNILDNGENIEPCENCGKYISDDEYTYCKYCAKSLCEDCKYTDCLGRDVCKYHKERCNREHS